MKRRWWICVIALGSWLGVAHALRANIKMELLAINDEVALLDYHVQACAEARRAWLLVDLKSGETKEMVRQRDADRAHAPSCSAATAELAAELKRRGIDGVHLDAKSCGKHDSPWWMTGQALIDPAFGATWSLDAKAPNVTKLSRSRLEHTMAALAQGTFHGKRWTVTTTGAETTIALDGKPLATIPAPRPNAKPDDLEALAAGSPLIAVTPNQRAVLVGDPDRGVIVYGIEGGRATRRTPTKAR